MGMLLHRTLMKQQEEARKRKKTAESAEPVVKEEDEYNVPVKRTVNRRKTSDK